MPLNAGRLRHRVTIQQPRSSDNRDVLGQPVNAWPDVATVFAGIEPLSSTESWQAQKAQGTVTHLLIFRYRAGLTKGMRAQYADPNAGPRYFYFDGAPTSEDEGREFMQVLAEERT